MGVYLCIFVYVVYFSGSFEFYTHARLRVCYFEFLVSGAVKPRVFLRSSLRVVIIPFSNPFFLLSFQKNYKMIGSGSIFN